MNSKMTLAKRFAKKNKVETINNGFTYRWLKSSPSKDEAKMSHPTNMSTMWTFKDESVIVITDGDVFVA